MERQFLFFLFLGISQPILAWNEAITVFFNLLNFFAIFLEFSLKRQGGTKQNDNFYFLSEPFPTNFGMKSRHNGIFQFSEFFCYFFGIFYYALGGNETERQFLFSLFLGLFQPILAWKEAIIGFFNFLKIFAIFLEFSFTR